jgi:thiamine biosynthesis lipoprotein
MCIIYYRFNPPTADKLGTRNGIINGKFMDKEKKRTLAAIFAANITLAFFCIAVTVGCRSKSPYSIDSGERLVMGTVAHITAVADDRQTARQCIDAASEQIDIIENLFSYHRSDSEISRINRDAFNAPVKASRQVYQLIKRSVEFSRLTSGAFDITVGPLVNLWHQAGEANSTPTAEEIASARSKVGYEKLILDDVNSTVRFGVDGMRLDLGAIAKGYAVDVAIEAIREGGGIGGLVNIGGEIRCFGTPPKGKKHWLIGLQNPDLKAANQTILTLKINDKAVSTSGDYQRFVSIGGRHFSHIIDLKSGRSAEAFSSVTIITEQATDADALATAVSVMGGEKGLNLIESIPFVEAIFISPAPDYKITKTSGADKFIK